jgi:hypothetical protein
VPSRMRRHSRRTSGVTPSRMRPTIRRRAIRMTRTSPSAGEHSSRRAGQRRRRRRSKPPAHGQRVKGQSRALPAGRPHRLQRLSPTEQRCRAAAGSSTSPTRSRHCLIPQWRSRSAPALLREGLAMGEPDEHADRHEHCHDHGRDQYSMTVVEPGHSRSVTRRPTAARDAGNAEPRGGVQEASAGWRRGARCVPESGCSHGFHVTVKVRRIPAFQWPGLRHVKV